MIGDLWLQLWLKNHCKNRILFHISTIALTVFKWLPIYLLWYYFSCECSWHQATDTRYTRYYLADKHMVFYSQLPHSLEKVVPILVLQFENYPFFVAKHWLFSSNNPLFMIKHWLFSPKWTPFFAVKHWLFSQNEPPFSQ